MAVKGMLRKLFGGRAPSLQTAESDVEEDPATADSRPVGGVPDKDDGDAQATTGPGKNGPFVGRVSGEDVGDVGESGAEARAREADDRQPRK